MIEPPSAADGWASREQRLWYVDGNNVFGSKPDGWWNDRAGAMARFTDRVALWCRSHGDPVTLVFDRPVPDSVVELGGGNLRVLPAMRAGRNAADTTIVELVSVEFADIESANGALDRAQNSEIDDHDDDYHRGDGDDVGNDGARPGSGATAIVVTSDQGLRKRLPAGVEIWGVGRFRHLIGY